MRRDLVLLSLALVALVTMGAGWRSGPRFGAGLAPGFAPVQRVTAGTDTRIAWNADPDCVYFDTTDDYASAPTATDLPGGTTPRTFMMWLKDEEPTGFCVVFSYGSINQYTAYSGWLDHGKILSAFAGNKIQDFTRSDSWRHYAWVTSDEYMRNSKIYVNAVLQEANTAYAYGGSASATFLTRNDIAPLNIGRWVDNGFYGSQRKMAEFAIFNKALSQSEIENYYPYKFTGTEDGLIRLYHMDEGSGKTCADSKGGYTMGLYGAIWTTK